MNDYRKISINGYVTIKNGDTVIVERGKNAIVVAGLAYVAGILTNTAIQVFNSSGNAYIITLNFGSCDPVIKFGKGNNTPTTQLMTTLQSLVNINANIITNTAGASNPGNGNVFTRWVGTFAPGVFSASLGEGESLGEIGLWLNVPTPAFSVGANLTPSTAAHIATNTTVTLPSLLVSRFNLGDAAFIPDTGAPVVVEWEFGWEFI